jgi:hypothetical protein
MNIMFSSENNFVRHCLTRKYKNVGVVVVLDAVTNYLLFFGGGGVLLNIPLFCFLLLWLSLVGCFTGALWDFGKHSSSLTNGSSY